MLVFLLIGRMCLYPNLSIFKVEFGYTQPSTYKNTYPIDASRL